MEVPTNIYSDYSPPKGSLAELLNQPVNEKFLKEHDYYKGHFYLPIEKNIFLLNKIFPNKYRIEILYSNIVYGVAWMNLRVHYFNYDTESWDFVDGSAALKIGTDTDATFQKLRSEATKSACKLLGKIFGGDLNREPEENKIPDKWQSVQVLFDEVFDKLKSEDIEPIQLIIANKVEAKRAQVIQKLSRLKPKPPRTTKAKTKNQIN